jgi:intracellular septation protein A
MKKVVSFLKFAFENFGPLIAFYGTNHFFGMRAALGAALAYALTEVAYKLVRRQKLTALFKISAGLSVAFGVLDLCLKNPIFFRFEGAISNVITGGFFAATLWSKKTLIQEVAEKRAPGKPIPPERLYRFRALTIMWVAYFFAKAVAYAWISMRYSLEEALAIRTAVGTTSFYAMLGFSLFLSKRFFDLLDRLKPS